MCADIAHICAPHIPHTHTWVRVKPDKRIGVCRFADWKKGISVHASLIPFQVPNQSQMRLLYSNNEQSDEQSYRTVVRNSRNEQSYRTVVTNSRNEQSYVTVVQNSRT